MKSKTGDSIQIAASKTIQIELTKIMVNMKKRLADTQKFLKEEKDPGKIQVYLAKDNEKQKLEIEKIQGLYQEMNALNDIAQKHKKGRK
jgi:hypothetical protein